MARDQITYLWTSAGIKTLSDFGSRPTRVRFTCSQKNVSLDGVAHMSDGTVIDNGTDTWSECESFYMDVYGGRTFRDDNCIVSQHERVSNAITEVFRVEFDSWTSTGIKVNVTVKSGGSYVVNVEYET